MRKRGDQVGVALDESVQPWIEPVQPWIESAQPTTENSPAIYRWDRCQTGEEVREADG